MVAPQETMDNSVRDFQRLKTSLHRQIVDVIDFSKAEAMTSCIPFRRCMFFPLLMTLIQSTFWLSLDRSL